MPAVFASSRMPNPLPLLSTPSSSPNSNNNVSLLPTPDDRRSVRDDYRNDKAASYYASACEQMAYCLLLKSASSAAGGGGAPGSSSFELLGRDGFGSPQLREVETLLETAAAHYYRSAQAAVSSVVSSTAGSAVAALIAHAATHAPGSVGASAGGAAGTPASLQQQPSSASLIPAAGAPLPSPSTASTETTSPAAIAKRLAIRLATRVCMVAADVAVASSSSVLPSGAAAAVQSNNPTHAAANARLRETAAMLRRTATAEGDGSLASALLTEQAAIACIRSAPPCHRRAAYHMATAGPLYASAGHPRHAVRCLSAALTVYGDGGSSGGSGSDGGVGGWALVTDQLYLNLSSRLALLGDAGSAAGFLTRVLAHGASRLPASAQRSILREFGRTYMSWCDRRRYECVKKVVAGAVKAGRVSASAVAAAEASTAITAASSSATGTTAALTSLLHLDDQAVASTEADKSTELQSPSLPVIHDTSVQIVSWSNGWVAGLAVAQAWNGAGGQGDQGARDASAGGAAGASAELARYAPPQLPGLVSTTLSSGGQAGMPSRYWSTDPRDVTLARVSGFLLETGA